MSPPTTPSPKARLMARAAIALAVLVVVLLSWLAIASGGVKRAFVRVFSKDYGAKQASVLSPAPEAGRIEVGLTVVAEGIKEPTDIQFPPGVPGYAVVLEKPGTARWLRIDSGVHGQLLEVDVLTVSEQGLLGLAFHPAYADNGRFFLNCVQEVDGEHRSRVIEYRASAPEALSETEVEEVRVILEVDQPYQNHNAGQLAFGPDGKLYIGWGDGGYRDDPHGHGQNPSSFKGSMLRIDVDKQQDGKPYAVPEDNPFLGNEKFAPEVYAYGLRNPWRYSFTRDGRLVVADVGQRKWEEIDIVRAGDNLGWNVREGLTCFREHPADCERDDLVDPIFVYGRDLGTSVTGGYVYAGRAVPELQGLYVFGDFVSGRMFAINLPTDRNQPVRKARSLGKWPLLISSFGQGPDGELYVAAYGRGQILRLIAGGSRLEGNGE